MRRNKPWYTKSWGITLAILTLPLFGLWYVWIKSGRGTVVRVSLTVFLLAVYLGGVITIVHTLPSNTLTAKTVITKNKETTTVVPQPSKSTVNTAVTDTTPTKASNTTSQTDAGAISQSPSDTTPKSTTNTSVSTPSTPTSSSSTTQATTPTTTTTPTTPTPAPQPTVTKTYECWYTVGSQYSYYAYLVHVTYYSNGTQDSYQTELGYNSNVTDGYSQCPGNTAPQ